MARKKVETKEVPQPEQYIQEGGVEAHIIADMLRIESITAELREFKDDTKSRPVSYTHLTLPTKA